MFNNNILIILETCYYSFYILSYSQINKQYTIWFIKQAKFIRNILSHKFSKFSSKHATH